MFIGPNLIFLHPPKTAGMFVSRWLEQAGLGEIVPERGPGWRHAGYLEVPEFSKRHAVLSTIRNPWNWYVSWYHYTLPIEKGAQPTDFHRPFAVGTDGSFQEVISRALKPSLSLSKNHKDRWPVRDSGPALPLVRITDSLGIGLYSYFFLRILLRDPRVLTDITRDELADKLQELLAVDAIVATEKVTTELPSALKSLGFSLPDATLDRLERLPKVNAAAGAKGLQRYNASAQSFYSQELLKLVAEREWPILDLVRYSGPDGQPCNSPWIRHDACDSQ